MDRTQMALLEEVKNKIIFLGGSKAAGIMAHAAWAACDHRDLPGPAPLTVSASLDFGNLDLFTQLCRITHESDYSNLAQELMLKWLHENDWSGFVAKKVKTTKKKLVDWE